MEKEKEIFPKDPNKTYALMGLIKGTSPQVEQAPEDEVMSWPHLIYREVLLGLVLLIFLLIISMLFNAPLEKLANPTHPPNPAKAPWYFLGLQEMVSYSALVGGIIIPGLVVLGLMIIPYIDYKKQGVGIWFHSQRGRKIAILSAIGTLIVIPILIGINEKYSVRTLYPNAPQILVEILNPASILLVLMACLFFLVLILTQSVREASIALFTSFMVATIVLTIVGTFFRGPNWAWIWPWQSGGI